MARAPDPAARAEAQLWGGSGFARRVVEAMRDDLPDAVYTFHLAGLELLRHAREHGRRGVLDQTIAPQDVLDAQMAQETRRFPH